MKKKILDILDTELQILHTSFTSIDIDGKEDAADQIAQLMCDIYVDAYCDANQANFSKEAFKNSALVRRALPHNPFGFTLEMIEKSLENL